MFWQMAILQHTKLDDDTTAIESLFTRTSQGPSVLPSRPHSIFPILFPRSSPFDHVYRVFTRKIGPSVSACKCGAVPVCMRNIENGPVIIYMAFDGIHGIQGRHNTTHKYTNTIVRRERHRSYSQFQRDLSWRWMMAVRRSFPYRFWMAGITMLMGFL